MIFLLFIFSMVILLGANINIENKLTNLINVFHKSETYKKLVFGRANDSISLDPACTTEVESFKVTVNIFDTLVKYEEEGSQIVPCLAESWKSSEDGLTWVFRLRQDVRFHDGTHFDAHAVEFNFHRWMNADSPYHVGQFNYWNYIFGGFPGSVKSVKALSDYSVEIVLKKPYAPFLSAMAMPVFGIGSPEAIKKYNEEFYKHPVGTGPFSFKSWKQGESIVIVRNNKYWGESAKLDEVEFKVIPSSRERLLKLRQGEIHITDNLSFYDLDEVKRDTRFRLYLRPCFNVGYMAMNTEKPPYDNKEVRVAISQAINKEKLIRDLYDNMAKPASTLVPPFLWGHNENIKPYKFNPKEAKRILAEEGYPNGFETTLWVMNSPRAYFPEPVKVAQFIKDSLAQVNIQVNIKIFSWDEYLNRVQNGEHELMLMGWTGDNIDPDNFLYTLLASDNAKPGLAGNYAFYKNKIVDTMLEQARQTTNIKFRRSLYRTLQEIVNNDMPTVPLVHTMPPLASLWTVKGYKPHLTGAESLEKVDIVEKE